MVVSAPSVPSGQKCRICRVQNGTLPRDPEGTPSAHSLCGSSHSASHSADCMVTHLGTSTSARRTDQRRTREIQEKWTERFGLSAHFPSSYSRLAMLVEYIEPYPQASKTTRNFCEGQQAVQASYRVQQPIYLITAGLIGLTPIAS